MANGLAGYKRLGRNMIEKLMTREFGEEAKRVTVLARGTDPDYQGEIGLLLHSGSKEEARTKEQLAALKKHHEEEITHHIKEIERLQKEIERHKKIKRSISFI
ncbi:ATPase inhibitor, mitochondrial-like [Phoca vitulina]|uniref:ATPase inhibitor, mitochondrial-like n=1 Tax=Phoca vitulina TaxID=9720 RepID=UPI0013965BC2|nr:ATPase inhibitor, mitochondrial-like [Phoca vitulina]